MANEEKTQTGTKALQASTAGDENTPPPLEQKAATQTLDKPKPVETVTIPKDAWDKVLADMAKLKENDELLREVADKGRLERIEGLRKQGKLIKSVNISGMNGKKILGWITLKNIVEFDFQGRLIEDQTVKLFFQDKSEMEMRLVSFNRNKTFTKGEVIAESKDMDGKVTYKVMFPDGETLEISENFVN